MSKLHILVVGYGNMGRAIAKGWETLEVKPTLTIIDPHSDKADFPTLSDLPAGQNFDAVLLAVKPQIMPDILATLKPHLHSSTIVISIAAGLPFALYRNAFGEDQPIIRAMPNTPAAIGLGITAVYTDDMSEVDQDIVLNLFLPCGPIEWVEQEDQFHAITALSGSGPAYVFHLIEAMCEAGIKAGLPDYLAESLARQTVIGSAALADTMHEMDISALREAVTSPKGTTEAGLSVLMPELSDLMTRTIARATARSRVLSDGTK